MARSKHAAALFEVMKHGAKKQSSTSGRALGSVGWLKPRNEPDHLSQDIDPNDPTTGPIQSRLIAPRVAAVEPLPVEAAPPKVARPQVGAVVARPRRDAADPTRPVAHPRPSGNSGSDVDFSKPFHYDRARQEVSMRVGVPAIAIGVFAACVLVGMAYILGRHDAPGPELASTIDVPQSEPTTETPRKSTLQPGVIDVSHKSSKIVSPTVKGSDTSHVRDLVPAGPMANSAQGMHVNVRPSAALAVEGPRMIGLNYIIVQAYPSEDEARDARDFLIKNGIRCTIEKAMAWAPKWYSVVTTQGFEHIRTPDCEGYKKQIEKLSDKYAGAGRFKKFDPFLCKWN